MAVVTFVCCHDWLVNHKITRVVALPQVWQLSGFGFLLFDWPRNQLAIAMVRGARQSSLGGVTEEVQHAQVGA